MPSQGRSVFRPAGSSRSRRRRSGAAAVWLPQPTETRDDGAACELVGADVDVPLTMRGSPGRAGRWSGVDRCWDRRPGRCCRCRWRGCRARGRWSGSARRYRPAGRGPGWRRRPGCRWCRWSGRRSRRCRSGCTRWPRRPCRRCRWPIPCRRAGGVQRDDRVVQGGRAGDDIQPAARPAAGDMLSAMVELVTVRPLSLKIPPPIAGRVVGDGGVDDRQREHR